LSLLTVIEAVVIGAPISVFLARWLRTWEWVKKQMAANRKPWACDLCMAFWPSLAQAALATGLSVVTPWEALLALPACAGAASVALTVVGDRVPPELPE
jgi:hypothetical protein